MQHVPPDNEAADTVAPDPSKRKRRRGQRLTPAELAQLPPGPAPGAGTLRNAALAHLARYSATEIGLVRVLDRRIQRWASRAVTFGDAPDRVAELAAAARAAARLVATSMVVSGVVDDAAYAAARARSLTRSGRSRRVIGAHLAQRGIDPDLAAVSLSDDADTELAAALTQARRRRIGPFGDPDGQCGDEAGDDPLAEARVRNRALGALARAGFSRDVAERALSMDREEADRLILHLKRL